MNKYQIEILPNKVPLITVPLPGSKVTTVLLVFKTGSKNESEQTNGLSHFLEHMFFKGTSQRPSTLALASELDSLGGEYNAFTTKEFTGYWLKVVNNKLPKAIEILGDMMFNSLFASEEIDRERGVIIEELNMYRESPQLYIGDVFESCLYEGTAAGREIIGTKENILAFSRQDFLDYLQAQYGAKSAQLIVAGEIKAADKKLIKTTFSQFSQHRFNKLPRLVEKQTVPRLKILAKKSDQTTLALGLRTVKLGQADEFKLELLAIILGGSMSSRLFINLRERNGLAYYVRTRAEFYSDSGYLVTQAGVAKDKTEEAVKIILQEHQRLATELVSAKELKRAKDILRGRLLLGLEGSDSVANWYALQALYRPTPLTPNAVAKIVQAITGPELLRVAKKYFTDSRLNLALIGEVNQSKLKANLKFKK